MTPTVSFAATSDNDSCLTTPPWHQWRNEVGRAGSDRHITIRTNPELRDSIDIWRGRTTSGDVEQYRGIWPCYDPHKVFDLAFGRDTLLGVCEMAVYRGVVKGNTVVLDDSVELPDGAIVEVRAVAASLEEEIEREEAFKRHLLELGVIKHIPERLPDPPGLDRTPIELDGPPLSQTIIEERR